MKLMGTLAAYVNKICESQAGNMDQADCELQCEEPYYKFQDEYCSESILAHEKLKLYQDNYFPKVKQAGFWFGELFAGLISVEVLVQYIMSDADAQASLLKKILSGELNGSPISNVAKAKAASISNDKRHNLFVAGMKENDEGKDAREILAITGCTDSKEGVSARNYLKMIILEADNDKVAVEAWELLSEIARADSKVGIEAKMLLSDQNVEAKISKISVKDAIMSKINDPIVWEYIKNPGKKGLSTQMVEYAKDLSSQMSDVKLPIANKRLAKTIMDIISKVGELASLASLHPMENESILELLKLSVQEGEYPEASKVAKKQLEKISESKGLTGFNKAAAKYAMRLFNGMEVSEGCEKGLAALYSQETKLIGTLSVLDLYDAQKGLQSDGSFSMSVIGKESFNTHIGAIERFARIMEALRKIADFTKKTEL